MTLEFSSRASYTLAATCASRLGTVPAVSGFLAARGCCLTDLQQFDDIITERFFLHATLNADPERTPAPAQFGIPTRPCARRPAARDTGSARSCAAQ